MNELELKKLWQTAQEKLDTNLAISTQNTAAITHIKVAHFLSSMKPIKLFTILVGVVWVGLLGTVVVYLFLNAFPKTNLFFLFSATIQVMLSAIALITYSYQLITIYQVDISGPILETQKKIAHLKSTTLWVTRLLFLQLPVWTTFYWNDSMLDNGSWLLWFLQGSITFACTYLSIWLFININFENRDKKWFRFIFNGNDWTPLLKSMELLEQIDAYQNDNKPQQSNLS